MLIDESARDESPFAEDGAQRRQVQYLFLLAHETQLMAAPPQLERQEDAMVAR